MEEGREQASTNVEAWKMDLGDFGSVDNREQWKRANVDVETSQKS